MAFDMGFDFRGTAGYVIDPSYAVPVLASVAEPFPHTYTNGNGLSINAGYSFGNSSPTDRDNTNDPRIAGINFNSNGAGNNAIFKIDLSSGSAPGAGNYTVDLAVGDAAGGHDQDLKILDDTTVLITVSATTAADHYIDATLADVAATATWTGTPVSTTFATTTAYVSINPNVIASNVTIAHFRLTLVPPVGGHTPRRLLTLGVGA